MRAVTLHLGFLSVAVSLALAPACGHDNADGTTTSTAEADSAIAVDTNVGTVTFDSGETPDSAADSLVIADSTGTTTTPTDTATDTTTGPCNSFGCPCNGNGDCLDELCIEGIDGRICTRTCVASCPDGFDCINSTAVGPDAISICVPRHTRLCRPCREDADCAASDDPFPSYCLPAPDPEEGSFCGSGCANRPCPEGFTCEDTPLPAGGAALQCVPLDGAMCACRPSWDGLGFVTDCGVENAFGTCTGSRGCDATGLTACDGPQASAELCDGADNDCDGEPDNIEAGPCQVQSLFGICPGTFACGDDGPFCDGPEAQPETCNGIDDNCNSQTDEGGCDDGLICTTDTCNAQLQCVNNLEPNFCVINDACYANGAFNPLNPCETCVAASNTTGWTQTANTCVIAGACVPANGLNPTNACQVCDPAQSTVTWSTAANTCTIGGQCYQSNAANPANACEVCQPSTSTTAWTQAVQTCNIQGQCYAAGLTKPGEPCQVCDPARNATGWSNAPLNTSCSDGNACSVDDHCNANGACVGDTSCNDGIDCTTDTCTASGCNNTGVPSGYCRIGGACYTQGTPNPSNVCESCNRSAAQQAWSPRPSSVACSDGNACTSGDSCNGSGQCVGGPGCNDGLSCTTDVCNPSVGCSYPTASGKCKINDSCYDNNATQPGNVCYRCNASASNSSWSLNNGAVCSDGNTCTSSDRCSSGQCNGTPITDGFNNTANDSRSGAYYLGTIADSDDFPDDASSFSANLYPSGDRDWYRYKVDDNNNFSQPRPEVLLSSIPAGMNYDLCLYWNCDDVGDGQSVECNNGSSASTNGGLPGCCKPASGSTSEQIEFQPTCDNGGFGADDDTGTVYIYVRRISGTPTCSNYTITWGDH